MLRKLVYYVACTVDGFIARDDGSFDWALSRANTSPNSSRGFPRPFRPWHQASVCLRTHAIRYGPDGTRTYEVGLNEGITNPYHPLRQFVVSGSFPKRPILGCTCIAGLHSNWCSNSRQSLARTSGCAAEAGSRRSVHEIDELILKVDPVLIGSGVPLFANAVGTPRAGLLSTSYIRTGSCWRATTLPCTAPSSTGRS